MLSPAFQIRHYACVRIEVGRRLGVLTIYRITIHGPKPTYLTNNRRIETHQWLMTLHESFSQYHHGYTDQSRSTDQTYKIINWQTLFTWLWRWLPLRLSKRQSPTPVLFRTTLTRTITLYELPILLGSNHLLYFRECCSFPALVPPLPKQWLIIPQCFTAV